MLFPSYQENCPLAPIEAAACGMPVIYRDIEEYKSLYRYEYLKARSTAEFIRLARKMISDRQYYEEGLKISEQLLVQFDKELIREKLIAVYKSLLNNWESSIMLSAPLIS
jgi:1,2-diacylglycerol-3-alpha-glucose alpha-1,2-galactosyltransferase